MKKFNLTGGILNRPITVIMCTLIIVGFGIFSLTNLRVTLFPTLNIPVLAISSGYQNVAPEEHQLKELFLRSRELNRWKPG